MKILPFIVRGTSYYLKMSVKKLVPFLVVGLMLAAGDSVYAYSRGNGSIARGDDYPAYYKNGSQEIDQWRMYSRQCTSFVAFRLSNAMVLKFRQLMEMRMNGDIVLVGKVIV
ncbi:choline binding protein D [Streptococcus pneumoniae]|nr:choline binding protein D [Streptococcus pneumoniae]